MPEMAGGIQYRGCQSKDLATPHDKGRCLNRLTNLNVLFLRDSDGSRGERITQAGLSRVLVQRGVGILEVFLLLRPCVNIS